MLIAQHVSQGVRSLVAKIRRVRQRADAEGVADQDDGAWCHVIAWCHVMLIIGMRDEG
jgi:hypothetical protein